MSYSNARFYFIFYEITNILNMYKYITAAIRIP